MLKKLFQPKWKHAEPQTRLAAIQQLDSAQQDVFKQVFSNDQVSEIRFAALKQITDDQWLLQQLKHSDLEFSKAIIRRYRQLVESNGTILALIEQLQAQAHSNSLWMEVLCQLENNSPVFSHVLAKIEDQQALVYIVCHANAVENKLAALEKVDELDALKSIKKHVKDKRVSQLVRTRLDQAKDAQLAQTEAREQATKIIQAIAHLGKKAYESSDFAKFELLQKQWHALAEDYRDEQLSDYQQALNLAQAKFDLLAAEVAKQKQLEQASQARQQCIADLVALKQKLQQQASLNSQQLSSELQAIESSWQAASLVEDKAMVEQYRAHSEALHYYMQQLQRLDAVTVTEIDVATMGAEASALMDLIKPIKWPAGFAKPEKLAQLEAIAGQIKQYEQEQHKQLGYLDKRARELQQKIRAKNLKAANKLMHYLQAKIDELSEPFKLQALQRMEKVFAELQELRDWHEFATNPKREQLVAQMQALIDKDINPEQRFDEIQVLQAEWQSLSVSDYQQDQALWEQFKQAADRAFEPCAAYFAEKDSARQLNVQAKQTICAQLEEFKQTVDWTQIDWRALDKILQTAKKEWQAIQNIPYKQAKQINQRFHSIVKQLTNKLNTERDANVQARKDLLAQLKPLLELEDVNLAIDKALALKQQWRDCGFTYYKEDRKLWAQFQQQMDALFARKKDLQNAQNAAQLENAAKADTIIDLILQLTQLDDNELEQSEGKFSQLLQDFEQVQDLPKQKAGAIRKRLTAACNDYRHQVAGIESRRQTQLLQLMHQANQLCLQAENGEADETTTQEFATLSKVPESIQKRFEQALNGFIPNRDNEVQGAQITIAIEVLADVASPEQYRQQRTAYQLQQLKQAMTEQLTQEQKLQRLMELVGEFYGLTGISAANREAMVARILTAQSKLIG